MRATELALTIVVPLLVSTALIGWGIPPWTTAGPFERAADALRDSPVALGALLFVALSAAARYWYRAFWPEPAKPPSRSGRRATVLFVTAVSLAAVAAIGLRALVFQPYRVIGGSMLPTLEPGDLLGVNRAALGVGSGSRRALARAPQRGEIVAFEKVMDGRREGLVKRVVGLPGDRVAMRGGHPVINDWVVPSCDAGQYFYLGAGGGVRVSGRLSVEFLGDRAYLTTLTAASPPFDHYDVREGEVFVVGDNRNESRDSRAWNDGRGAGLPLTDLVGVAQVHLGTLHRDGRPAAGPIRALELTLGLEGLDTRELRAGIERCLANRPRATTPPPGRVTKPRAALVQNSNAHL